MRVLLDTNVVLDALLAREPFLDNARLLLEATETGQLEGFITATTLTDIYYVVRRQRQSHAVAHSAVSRLLDLLQVCSVDRAVLEQAIALEVPDFEDALQMACAIGARLDAIVTRDLAGFAKATLPVLSPGQLCRSLSDPDTPPPKGIAEQP